MTGPGHDATNVSLRHIRAFLAVAELSSFTMAGERLGLSQPALSLLIRQLELDLDLRLFDRTSRRTVLTSAGREFEQAVAKVLTDLEQAVISARDLALRKRGSLIVAAPPTLSAVLMAAVISEFQKAYEGVKVKLIDTTADIAELIRSGRVDLGVGTFSPQEQGIERSVLVRDALLVFCKSASELARKEAVRWKELEDRPLIALTPESGVRHLVDASQHKAGLAVRHAHEVSGMTTALAFVEAELGLAVLPTYALALRHGDSIVARPLIEPQVAREICAISARGRSLPPAGTQFLATLRKWARRSMPKLH
ncbi:LysR family transcriptional regulator [Rhodoplanes sp. Z2-YC6860]|uniref:LysR family transcriptional regulator n=1 Tax=Rhodoplanes sp. Z2-YC6860 TaxID=674703 RepID=UPI00078C6C05|nr:LysR family transcriptional regulator [Rhodoplanes sp. Z2-YC6860]AMN39918.1 LysR family transcriptional regulator [Rhodoplanes sp. Z2-YC6860]